MINLPLAEIHSGTKYPPQNQKSSTAVGNLTFTMTGHCLFYSIQNYVHVSFFVMKIQTIQSFNSSQFCQKGIEEQEKESFNG